MKLYFTYLLIYNMADLRGLIRLCRSCDYEAGHQDCWLRGWQGEVDNFYAGSQVFTLCTRTSNTCQHLLKPLKARKILGFILEGKTFLCSYLLMLHDVIYTILSSEVKDKKAPPSVILIRILISRSTRLQYIGHKFLSSRHYCWKEFTMFMPTGDY